jgi:hypothetical protein
MKCAICNEEKIFLYSSREKGKWKLIVQDEKRDPEFVSSINFNDAFCSIKDWLVFPRLMVSEKKFKSIWGSCRIYW